MPFLIPRDTLDALGGPEIPKLDSRSLFFDRFTHPQSEREERKNWFARAGRIPATQEKIQSWARFTQSAREKVTLFAQVQSRLMLNMAGGVMENAGLCLDRFGMPYIPGSAAKGCARRMAIQDLVDTEGAAAKASKLAELALVFGWGEQDWKAGRRQEKNGKAVEAEPYSDFWWAMAADSGDHSGDSIRDETWRKVVDDTAAALLSGLGRRYKGNPFEALCRLVPNFAGSVAFLPAYPLKTGLDNLPMPEPEMGKLELDILTCHHSDYYSKTRDKTGNLVMPFARDTEDPNSVVFPAVAPGHSFVFVLLPLRPKSLGAKAASGDLLRSAKTWLSQGLEIFGLGAKTNAGYGWFDTSAPLQAAIRDAWEKRLLEEEKQRQRAEAERLKAQKAEAERIADLERRSRLPKHEQYKEQFEKMDNDSFAATAKRFNELSDDEKLGFILALKQEKRETAKRWAKKKPELLKPCQEQGRKLQPPIDLP